MYHLELSDHMSLVDQSGGRHPVFDKSVVNLALDTKLFATYFALADHPRQDKFVLGMWFPASFFGIRRRSEVSLAPNCKLDENTQCGIRSLRVPGSICLIGSRVFFDCRSLSEMEYGTFVLYWHAVALDGFYWTISPTREVVNVSHLSPGFARHHVIA
jgi:hypothetical protein